jgi:hypothetical protein
MYTVGMSAHPRSLFHLIFLREIGSIVEFPVWWYSRGVVMILTMAQEGLEYSLKEKAFGLWMRNLFTPMYGDRSWTGRALSIFMRIVVLIWRGLSFLIQAWAYLLMLFCWLLLPLVGVMLLIRPLGSALFSFLIR